jgi:hypothetical protein
LAIAVNGLARRAPLLPDPPERRSWTELYAFVFALLGITYINLRKNVRQWVASKAMPADMAGVPTWVWFELAYLLLSVTVIALWARHQRRPLAIVPASWLGKGELLYLALLWWLVTGNFERALVSFAPERLVTEGVIFVVSLVSTFVLLAFAPPLEPGIEQPPMPLPTTRPALAKIVALGLLAAALSIIGDWAIVRAIYGDRFAGHAGRHIRFGPNATINQRERR